MRHDPPSPRFGVWWETHFPLYCKHIAFKDTGGRGGGKEEYFIAKPL